MSGRNGEPPHDDADYDVGYGKPPSHTRFSPGVSGNPKGRPKRAVGKQKQLLAAMDQPTREMFLDEMNRSVRVTSDGKKVSMPTKQMIIRSMAKTAAAGGQQAQRTALLLQLELERDLARERAEFIASVRSYKQEVGNVFERRRRLGLPELPLLPHPDDIFIDELAQTMELRGPFTTEQKVAFDEILAERDGCQRGVTGLLAEAKTNPRDWTLAMLASKAQERFDIINGCLPERYRKKLQDRMSTEQIEAARQRARKGLAARRRRRGHRRGASRAMQGATAKVE